jgi:hypothetical protein
VSNPKTFHSRGKRLCGAIIRTLDDVSDTIESETSPVKMVRDGRGEHHFMKAGIIIPQDSALAISVSDSRRLLADFTRVFTGYCKEIIQSNEPNLIMMGLRSINELYERKICYLAFAPSESSNRETVRYFYLNAFISASAPDSKNMVTSIGNTHNKDPVINSINVTDFGSDEAEIIAARKLQYLFGAEHARYLFGNQDGYKKFTRLMHGSVHGNHFSFHAAKLRARPDSGLMSLDSLKLGVALVLLIETLFTTSEIVQSTDSKQRLEKLAEKYKARADSFMTDLKIQGA